MSERASFKGSIHFFYRGKRNSPTQSLNFQVCVPLLTVAETLMSNFKDLNFSKKEKRALTQKHREKIQYFRNLTKDQMQSESHKLIQKLKNYQNSEITIQASEIGAYICLVAIFSGELPKNTNWRFELSSVPLGLFPQSLVKDKNAGQERDISFILEEDCWLKPFKSLYQTPNHLKFSSLDKIEEISILSQNKPPYKAA